MNTTLASLSLAATLLTAGLAGVGFFVAYDDEAAPATLDAHDDHNHATTSIYGFDVGLQRYQWPAAIGDPPTADEAQSLEEMHHIRITEDAAFTPSNGVRGGSGTPADPYVISGYYVPGDLYLQDTSKCVEIRDNFVGGQLSLNYIGDCVYVHDNHIDDLRVNENIRRTGSGTTGLITHNDIGYVGQIRHYDGEFSHNTVGPYAPGGMWDEVMETALPGYQGDLRIMNIDGYNQGWFHDNTFLGSVEIDLHGHHHSTGWTADHSHHHDAERAAMADGGSADDTDDTDDDGDGGDSDTDHHDAEAGPMMHDHTNRWNSVFFTGNRIVDPDGFGLRIEDRNHRGDDVQANSEQEPQLEMPHVHHTRIVIADNVIEDAPLWVDVFNADDDELHLERSPGELHLLGNTVHLKERQQEAWLGLFYFGGFVDANSAISVYAAKEVATTIAGNTVTFEAAPDSDDPLLPIFGAEAPMPAAIRVHGVRDATIDITDNAATGFTYGVLARELDDATKWSVIGNDFGAAQHPVWYDESVANEPLEE